MDGIDHVRASEAKSCKKDGRTPHEVRHSLNLRTARQTTGFVAKEGREGGACSSRRTLYYIYMCDVMGPHTDATDAADSAAAAVTTARSVYERGRTAAAAGRW